ncbi:MAG: hypothetical protein IJ711_10050 [Lachnospiraceae bacterium]|nr:hypothetical protein [Lachnospiraceae bacterium]
MIKNKLLKNLGLKILAVITAIVLWLIVVNISDPVISTTLSGISVEVTNADVLTSKGQIYQVLDGTDNISVSVSAKRTILDYLNTSNIRATADMSELNEADGTVRIRVESNRYNNQIDSIKPRTEYLKVKIENKKSAQFRIEPVVTGQPQEGYVVGNVQMNQNIVFISGPESVVSQISRAVTEFSVEGMSGNVSTNMDIKYYNADGETVDEAQLSQNIASVNLDIEILPTKEITVLAKPSGTPAAGYGVTGVVTIEPATIMIAGQSRALRDIESVQIPDNKLSVDGLNATLDTAVDITQWLPDGIILADEEYDGKVVVTVEIEELETRTVELQKSRISITNVPSGYTAVFGTNSETVTFDVTGLAKDLDELDMESVNAVVDVKAYMEENDMTSVNAVAYMMPISLELPDGITQKAPVNVNIRLQNKK